MKLAALALGGVVFFSTMKSLGAEGDAEMLVVDAASEKAETLAARAREETARDPKKAIALYDEAYAAAPAAVILFNIAVLHEQTHNSAEALSFYRRAVAAGDLEPALVTRANERIAALEKSPSPEVATSQQPQQQDQKRPPPDRSDRAAFWHPLRVTGAALGGAGGIALGVTGILATLAKSKDSEADSFCDGDRCTNPRALELTDDARGLATAATVTFVTGAVLIASGVVLWLVAPSSSGASLGVKSARGPWGSFTW